MQRGWPLWRDQPDLCTGSCEGLLAIQRRLVSEMGFKLILIGLITFRKHSVS